MANMIITGNCGNKVELRYTPDQKAVLTFSMALYTGGTKEKGYSDPLWVRVTAWEELAITMNEKLSKGKKVEVKGQPRPPREYADKDGQMHPAGLEMTAYEIAIIEKQEEVAF